MCPPLLPPSQQLIIDLLRSAVRALQQLPFAVRSPTPY
jgi:hypothetical protein